MKFSSFNVYVRRGDTVIIKNMLTGAAMKIPVSILDSIPKESLGVEQKILNARVDVESFVENGILVDSDINEFSAWKTKLLEVRNNEAHKFILHFLPTIQCQLRCAYCFENGGDRGFSMKPKILEQTIKWVELYLNRFKEINEFRMVLFGGEPLLRSDIGISALSQIQAICKNLLIDFWSEIITNGELLTEKVAMELSHHNWKRVQITLDGPELVHNARRPGVNGRPTFHKVAENVRMLLRTDYIPKVDIRLSFDLSNCDDVTRLLDEIVTWGDIRKISLSLGLITDTFVYEGDKNDPVIVQKALIFWKKAKALGFIVPEDQVAGPLCVAVAKHSAVVNPDGTLQKCFATAGRAEYNFGSIHTSPTTYTQDECYERWKRTDECIKDKCEFLPVCGGGCPHDAMIAHGDAGGSMYRFCQKDLLRTMNLGLIEIHYLP